MNTKEIKGHRVSFPRRLFQLLKLSETEGWEDTISWVDNGTGFKVHDRERFEKELLVKYFKTKRYGSFTRQLHAYDFNCVRTGRQPGIYSHPQFKRNDPEASCALKREASKTISKKAISERNQDARSNGIRAGDTTVQFPSILDISSFNVVSEDKRSQSSGIASLYRSVRSQVIGHTRKALVRIPAGVTLKQDLPCSTDTLTGENSWSLSSGRITSMKSNMGMNKISVPTPERDNFEDKLFDAADLEPIICNKNVGGRCTTSVAYNSSNKEGDNSITKILG